MAVGHDPAQLIRALLGRTLPDIRTGSSPKALCQAGANLETMLRLGMRQRLRICVGNEELNALKARRDHVVDSIATSSTHAEHQDARAQFSEVR